MSRPPQLIRQRCSASGENFYSYGMKPGGYVARVDIDTGKADCPVCGKSVTLRKHPGTGIRSTIPTHNRAKMKTLDGVVMDCTSRPKGGWSADVHFDNEVPVGTRLVQAEQAAPKAAPGEPAAIKMVGYGGCTGINDYLMSDGTIKTMRPHEVVWREAPQQEPVWDGKLSDAMQNALDALYLECGPGITRDITHQVQKECEAIYTSYTTTKRMYQAARDRLELLEAAQPQPDPFAAPQPAPAPLSDVVKDAARYAALRDGSIEHDDILKTVKDPGKWEQPYAVLLRGIELDSAIDAALATQKGNP